MATTLIEGSTISELRQSIAGRVIAPDDSEYNRARACFNALVDRRPAVIVRCAGAPDVVTALAFARAHHLQVAVRGGGHNPAGHAQADEPLERVRAAFGPAIFDRLRAFKRRFDPRNILRLNQNIPPV